MKNIKILFSLLLSALLVFSFSGCSVSDGSADGGASNEALNDAQEGILAVHFLDVGQGDSEFIELPNGETMLIDAGEADMGKTVVDDINEIGKTEITYLVATHPHSDHIGGLSEVLSAFDVENVYMPNAVSSSETYSAFLDAVEAENCNVIEAKNGVSIINGDSLSVEFIAPCSDEYKDLNNYSAVVKIIYGSTTFLFMGDAEELSEKEITASVNADVIKVGHHGSNTSSSAEFVSRVSAEYAVIECGENNSYGHPHQEIVERWEQSGAEVLRTDLLGDILISSDGTNIIYNGESSTQEQAPVSETAATDVNAEYKWVLNTSSKKIHTPDCSSVSDMNEQNKELSSKSISELEAEGYSACGKCKPSD